MGLRFFVQGMVENEGDQVRIGEQCLGRKRGEIGAAIGEERIDPMLLQAGQERMGG